MNLHLLKNSIQTPEKLANEALESVLRTQWERVPAVRLDSPPGAGKTGVVERLAVQSMAVLHERCMVVTQTNEQSFDLVRRLCKGFPLLAFILYAKKDLSIPENVRNLPNLMLVEDSAALPDRPCVVVGNASKWAWTKDGAQLFDCQIVDEAFQLADHKFHAIAGLARRFVLVGDPGQISPIVSIAIERWKDDPAGPHIAAPVALAARHPSIVRMALPVSRRLVQDTVNIVQPAFYPELPFLGLASANERRISLDRAPSLPMDSALDRLLEDVSLLQLELEERLSSEVDDELAATITALAERLLQRKARIHDMDHQRELQAADIGVICAHVAQVNAVRERLGPSLHGILVETADRFQGLERPIMLIHHPLSGRTDTSAFHLDAGRLCVMLSRHRIACIVVTRAGIEKALMQHAPAGDRTLGMAYDPEFEGWSAHMRFLSEMQRKNRSIRLAESLD